MTVSYLLTFFSFCFRLFGLVAAIRFVFHITIVIVTHASKVVYIVFDVVILAPADDVLCKPDVDDADDDKDGNNFDQYKFWRKVIKKEVPSI